MRSLAIALVVLSAHPVLAQDRVVLALDPGHTEVRVEELAQAIAEATQRDVVLPDTAPVSTALTITALRADRWLVRVERGERARERVLEAPRRAPIAALARASRELLASLDAPFAWYEVDLLDPFHGRGAWDPLAEALSGEVITPFTRPRFECAAVADPFAPGAWIDLMDPWH